MNVSSLLRRSSGRSIFKRRIGRHETVCGGAEARGRKDGFTLVEILVVITIIGLIMGLVGPRVLNYLTESKAKAAKIQIESFSSALDLYFLDNGGYPSGSEGLTT